MLSKAGTDFSNSNAEKKYSACPVYGQSKLANILHAKELQRRFDAENIDIIVTSLHPGMVETNLARHVDFGTVCDYLSSARNYKTSMQVIFTYKKVTVGASTNVYCAVSPDVIKGEFYSNNALNTDLLNEKTNNVEMPKNSGRSLRKC